MIEAIYSWLVDLGTTLQENFRLRDLLDIFLMALGVVFATPLFQFGWAYTVAYAMGLIKVDIQGDLCAKLLTLPLSFHHRLRRGDLIARTTADAGSAHAAPSLLFGDFVQSIAMILILNYVVTAYLF